MCPTGPQLKEDLAPRIGLHPATFDRYLADLARAGLIQRSGLGGGKAAFRLPYEQTALILLGLASPTPTGAGAAAKALGKLFQENPQVGDASLATGLAHVIRTYAQEISQGKRIDRDDDDWELILCLDPLSAWMSWPSKKVERRFFDYIDAKTIAEPTSVTPIIRRQTILTKPLLVAVARLYAASLSMPVPASDSAHASAPVFEAKNAGLLPGSPAPSVPPISPNARASDRPDSHNSPGSIRSRARNQRRTPSE
jgi:hypothetical protein